MWYDTITKTPNIAYAIIVLVILVIIAIILSIWALIKAYSVRAPDVTVIRQDLNAFKTATTSTQAVLRTDIDSINERLDVGDGDIDLGSAIALLRASTTKNEGDIAALATGVESQFSQLRTEIGAEIETLTGAIEAIDLTSLETRVGEAETQLGTLEQTVAAIAPLTGRVSAVETAIATVDGRVTSTKDELESAVIALDDKIDTVDTKTEYPAIRTPQVIITAPVGP